MIERGYEGYVAKDEASGYEGGASSPAVDEKLERLEGPPCALSMPPEASAAR